MAAVITVNSTADTNARDEALTLREAILINNHALDVALLTAAEQGQVIGAPTSTDADAIGFDIPGAGVHTIKPTSALPRIIQPVVIDGYTQPGASPNTNPLTLGPGALGSNAVLQIELDGSNAGHAAGLHLQTVNSTVRGLVINRFKLLRSDFGGGIGILIEGWGHIIEGNFIGTDASGLFALGNDRSGVFVDTSSNNLIGGVAAASRNLIAGNQNEVTLYFTGGDNLVQGNLLGTDSTGTRALGTTAGVHVSSYRNTIGGLAPGAGNVIATGIAISADHNIVQGNFIGTDVTGTVGLGNRRNGVYVVGSGNIIGGTVAGAGNVIAFNELAGVRLAGSNAVLANSIFSNGGLGIDLYSSDITPNDPDDADEGPNTLQNFPEISSAFVNAGLLTVTYRVPSSPAHSAYPLRVEFFKADESGQEGKCFLGFDTYSAAEAGQFKTLVLAAQAEIGPGDRVLGTASGLAFFTSEFGRSVLIPGPTDLQITKTNGAALVVQGEELTYTIVVSNAGPNMVGGPEIQSLTVGGLWGDFRLTFNGSTTFDLPRNATAFAVQTAINSLPTVHGVGGRVSVSQSDNVFTITFAGTLGSQDVPQITVSMSEYVFAAAHTIQDGTAGATVSDMFPASLTDVTFTAVGTGGAGGFAAGTGNLHQIVNLPVGGTITYSVRGMLSPTATGTLDNVATITPPADVAELDPTDNTARDLDEIVPRQADLQIFKTDGVPTIVPGTGNTYTIVVSNAGPHAVGVAEVQTVTLDASATTFWLIFHNAQTRFLGFDTTAAQLQSALNALSSIGGIGGSVTVTKSNNEFTIVFGGALGSINVPGLQSAGGGIVVATKRNGVPGATVTDMFPAEFTGVSFTSVGTGGASGFADGTGDIVQMLSLPAGASVTYTVRGTISPAATEFISNTATVSAPGYIEDNPDNNSATDTDLLVPQADIQITKSDGVAVASPGDNVTYTLVASNSGPSSVVGAVITDIFPSGIENATFTAAGAGGASGYFSGSGNIEQSVNLPPGATITYTVTAKVSASATGTLTNVATITAPPELTELNSGNNIATDIDLIDASFLVVGAEASSTGQPRVNVYDSNGRLLSSFLAYEKNYRGGVRVALADVTGDGVQEVVTAPGRGHIPLVKVFNTAGVELEEFRVLAYAANFMGGVYVAVGDVLGDSLNDIVVTPGREGGQVNGLVNGGTEVRVFKNRLNIAPADPFANAPSRKFLAFAPVTLGGLKFLGGGTVATGDIQPGGKHEVIVGSGPGMRTSIRVFNIAAAVPTLVRRITPFTASFYGGAFVTSARIDGDLAWDIVAGAGQGGGSRLEVRSGRTGVLLHAPLILSASSGSLPVIQPPLRVVAKDTNGDGVPDQIYFSEGPNGRTPVVRRLQTLDSAAVDFVLTSSVQFGGGLNLG